jgi:hypothetical protein
MPLCYAKNKVHILKWKENNLDRSREIDREYKYKAYHIMKGHDSDYMSNHIFQKECRKFRNIRF